jgi:hypothetical protein
LRLGLVRRQGQGQVRRTTTYGVHSDSDSESDEEEEEEGIEIEIGPKVGDSGSDLDLADPFKYVSITPTRFVSLLYIM